MSVRRPVRRSDGENCRGSMNIFDFRQQLIDDYAGYTRSFIQIRDPQIRGYVAGQLEVGVLWPDPLIQLNPSTN